jgi:hypothetical protein
MMALNLFKSGFLGIEKFIIFDIFVVLFDDIVGGLFAWLDRCGRY